MVQISPHSCTMWMSAYYWTWGHMCAVFSLVVNKDLSLSSDLWVACMRLPSGRSTCGPMEILTLFWHSVWDFMYFCLYPMSTMPYMVLVVGGLPLYSFYPILFWFKFTATLALSIFPRIFILLFSALNPNCHTLSRKSLVPLFILLMSVALVT